MHVLDGTTTRMGNQARKLSLSEMQAYKQRLALLTDAELADTVFVCSELARLFRKPWSWYHLARDEQINRIQEELHGQI